MTIFIVLIAAIAYVLLSILVTSFVITDNQSVTVKRSGVIGLLTAILCASWATAALQFSSDSFAFGALFLVGALLVTHVSIVVTKAHMSSVSKYSNALLLIVSVAWRLIGLVVIFALIATKIFLFIAK